MDNIEKERDYRARTFNIAGFALMAPMGHVSIDPIILFNQFKLIGFIFYLSVCLLLFLAGFYLIDLGRDILLRRR